MQKIMFESRRFGLEQAVIALLKEMTRRRVCFPKGINDADVESAVMGIDDKGRVYFTFTVSTHWGAESVDVYPKYQIGERVAVAQSYHTLNKSGYVAPEWWEHMCEDSAGYDNKLFVRADLMPNVIEITDIKAERLQDISDEDCLREGIFFYKQPPLHHEYDRYAPWSPSVKPYKYDCDNLKFFCTPRAAFHCLLDALNGRGTWERNEWQFAYTFKLIK